MEVNTCQVSGTSPSLPSSTFLHPPPPTSPPPGFSLSFISPSPRELPPSLYRSISRGLEEACRTSRVLEEARVTLRVARASRSSRSSRAGALAPT